MVVLLAAAAVRPRGVVLALAAQLPLVEHAAVGVQVALAPETEGRATDDGDINRIGIAPINTRRGGFIILFSPLSLRFFYFFHRRGSAFLFVLVFVFFSPTRLD